MHSLIACCPTLNVLLKNAVKSKWGILEGVYKFHGFTNGMDYWVHADGSLALWYYSVSSTYLWLFAPLDYLGALSAFVASESYTNEKKCPNNEGYIWEWQYEQGGAFLATNDVYVKCANEDDFCTSENPCGTDEGDCDTHDQCQEGLSCGSNNCPDFLSFHSEFDCCYTDPNAGNSKKQMNINESISDYRRNKYHLEYNIPKHLWHSVKEDIMLKLRPQFSDSEEEILLNPQFRNMYKKKSRIVRNIEQQKAEKRKTNSPQISHLTSNCEGKKTTYQKSTIVCSHVASSVQGLIVILNPNVQEYKTHAVKNNFIGFKTLVHSPYDFPYVEAVGKAIGPNIQSQIAFLGFHSWITDNADAYTPGQKNCASRRDIELDVFQDYTRKNCVFECQARSMFKMCGCLPYQYPEFHLIDTGIWKEVNHTACNYTKLLCLSEVKGMLCIDFELMLSFVVFCTFRKHNFSHYFLCSSFKLYLYMS